jgi:hypothetical protein
LAWVRRGRDGGPARVPDTHKFFPVLKLHP